MALTLNFRVITPVHNTREKILGLLAHLTERLRIAPEALVIVDDGSTDGTGASIRERYPAATLLQGDGSLLWTGAIYLGMEKALATGADYIFWLNHDCRPEPGALEKLTGALRDNPRAGCIGAYCHIAGFPQYPVNPGFKNFAPLEIKAGSAELVRADGLNGNFVGFRADAVRRVGLPDARRHPHYGDGPYTIRFSRAGFDVLVHTGARAELDYEVERRLPPFWRVALSSQSLAWWMRYYFTSFRSQYHWRYRWNDAVAYRGPYAVATYPKVQMQTLAGIVAGSALRRLHSRARILQRAQERFRSRWPVQKLAAEVCGRA